MSRLYLFGTFSLFIVLLIGCSSNSLPVESNNGNELKGETSINENYSRTIEHTETEYEEEQEATSSNDLLSTSQSDDSLKEMELLKETLRTYIFDEYMGSSDYVYAKGINWAKNFYDNLTAEEIWNVIEEYKEMNNGEGGTSMCYL